MIAVSLNCKTAYSGWRIAKTRSTKEDLTIVSDAIIAAIVTGFFALIVAIVSGYVSYVTATRASKRDLETRLLEARESGVQDRETAEKQYQLQAMRTFREVVGGPKSQIIEAVHDLSDRLRRFLSEEQPREWTDSTRTGSSGYYRRSFVWLVVRPFVWLEILRRNMVYLDQTLGSLVEDELRFLMHCHLLELSLTDVALFSDTDYDPEVASAHVFAGSLRAAAEQWIRCSDSRLVCIVYNEFEKDEDEKGVSQAEDVEQIVSDLHIQGRDTDFKLARLVALYCAANSLLSQFSLPFRQVEDVDQSLNRLDLISQELRVPILSNLRDMLGAVRHQK